MVYGIYVNKKKQSSRSEMARAPPVTVDLGSPTVSCGIPSSWRLSPSASLAVNRGACRGGWAVRVILKVLQVLWARLGPPLERVVPCWVYEAESRRAWKMFQRAPVGQASKEAVQGI